MENLFETVCRVRGGNLVERALLTTGASLDGSTWKDLTEYARGKDFLWVSQGLLFDVSCYTFENLENHDCLLKVRASDEDGQVFTLRVSRDVFVWTDVPAAMGVLFRLLATGNFTKLELAGGLFGGHRAFCVPGAVLMDFVNGSSQLECLVFRDFFLENTTFLALGTLSWKGLQIELHRCQTVSRAGVEALCEVLCHNTGPTSLDLSIVPPTFRVRLINTLRGNSSLKNLNWKVQADANERATRGDEENTHSLCQALAENQGLEYLNLKRRCISDDNLKLLCLSLARHPTLQVLDLRLTWHDNHIDAVENKISEIGRTRALVEMLKVNDVLRTLELDGHDWDREVLKYQVYPIFWVKKYIPYAQALQKASDEVRPQLVGRALGSVSWDASLSWLLLTSNVDAIFGSGEE